MLTTFLLSILFAFAEKYKCLTSAQILLFAQVNLHQSDEVTSNHEYKFMNKYKKFETQASLTALCMM